MGRGRVLFSKLLRKGDNFGKWMAAQGAAQAARRALRLAIPEAGGRHRARGGEEAQDRASQQRQFRQPLNTGGVMHELTMGTDHLFGTEGELFDRPAVGIE